MSADEKERTQPPWTWPRIVLHAKDILRGERLNEEQAEIAEVIVAIDDRFEKLEMQIVRLRSLVQELDSRTVGSIICR